MTITVGTLRDLLACYPDDCAVQFDGMDFCRVKPRGPKLVQIELSPAAPLSWRRPVADDGRSHDLTCKRAAGDR